MRDGRKLAVFYTGNRHDVLRYTCLRGWLDSGEPRCIGCSGMSVDETIAKEVLRVAQPAAVEAARLASEEEAHKQDEVLEAWKRDLETRPGNETWKRRAMRRSVRRNSTTRRIRKTDW